MYTAFPTEPVFPPAAAEGSQNKHARKVVAGSWWYIWLHTGQGDGIRFGFININTTSTIIGMKFLSSTQHHRETSDRGCRYTTYIQRYTKKPSILATIDMSRYISRTSGHGNIQHIVKVGQQTADLGSFDGTFQQKITRRTTTSERNKFLQAIASFK